MKLPSVFPLLCAASIGILVGHLFWPKTGRYEFHPGTGLFKGFMIRCDRTTGEISRLVPSTPDTSVEKIQYVTNQVSASDLLTQLQDVDQMIAWCASNTNGGVILEGTNDSTNGEIKLTPDEVPRVRAALYQERARVVQIINQHGP